MVKQKTKKVWAWILMGLGLFVITATHVGIHILGLSQNMIVTHANINLFAVVLIVAGLIVRGKF